MTVPSKISVFFSVENWTWDLQRMSPISRIPWSALRRIGKSRILALTILVPFLGPMLLFNEHVVGLFRLSEEFVGRWYVGEDTTALAKTLSLGRLYYLYFGLSFIGFASALFTLLCPLDIKTHGSAREFLEAEAAHVTNARLGMWLPEIAEHYLFWTDIDTLPGNYGSLIVEPHAKWIVFYGDPRDFSALFYAAMTASFLAIPEETLTQLIDADESDGEFSNHRGEPDPMKIANALVHGGNAYRWIEVEIRSVIDERPSFRTDILTLRYLSLDHSKPIFRIIVATLYGAGFALLLWPTLTTFGRIALKTVVG